MLDHIDPERLVRAAVGGAHPGCQGSPESHLPLTWCDDDIDAKDLMVHTFALVLHASVGS